MVDQGYDGKVGVTNPRIMELLNEPGLSELRRLHAKVTRLLEKELARQAKWAQGTRPFRYTGPKWKAQMEGRYLVPGDVVLLSESQAAAQADRFEEVVEEPA